ncbi:hypothetical protein C8Q79DRAFT_534611 [Trametes meyenii]|nr:hypothetical protein C8Q79DRAFT_534611 [Trametes meyenii]
MDFKPAGDFGIDCASGSASIASGGGSGPSTIYSSSATMSPVSEVSALMNPDAMFDFNGGISHTPVTSPPVQFAQPGTSFTVPLRVKTSTSSPLSSFASPTAAAEDSSHLALSAAASLSVSPGLGMASSNLELLSTSPALPSFKTHFANLTSSTHILNRVTLSTQDFNTTSAFAPSEACPIESAMPLPACLAPSATYLYHLFTETGEASGTLAPPEAPLFHSTYFLNDVAHPPILPPDLWVSPPGAPTYVAPGLHPAIPLPTPVSYQMQLSHLVALTKSMREAKLETEPVATGSGSNGGQKLEEHERTPQDPRPLNFKHGASSAHAHQHREWLTIRSRYRGQVGPRITADSNQSHV